MSAMSAERPEVVPSNKIALVGYTASRRLAPKKEDGWHVWGLNNLHLFEPASQFTAWFDLHPEDTIRSDQAHLAWLEGGADGLPVYMWDPRPEWPTSALFPKEEVLNVANHAYFTNSIAWMVALAILELTGGQPVDPGMEPPELAVYGIDMATGSEYASQRPSCEYFLGVAEGLGIKVTVPAQSDLLKTQALYGSPGSEDFRIRMEERQFELQQQLQELSAHIGQGEQQLMEMRMRHAGLQGAMEQTQYILGVWTQPVTRGNSTHETPSPETPPI